MVLQPAEYVSPDGRVRLEVRPSNRLGAGPAQYRLTVGEQEVWSLEHPFTLFEAAVADDGTVAGYGYTNAYDSYRGGSFVVAILTPNGEVRLREETARALHRHWHAPMEPYGFGVLLDLPNDRVLIRVADPDVNLAPGHGEAGPGPGLGAEAWWVYRLSTGEPWTRFVPCTAMEDIRPLPFILGARLVVGTPLVLVHWRHIRNRSAVCATFTLVDPDGRITWRLDRPPDFELHDGDHAAIERSTRVGILASAESGTFRILFHDRQQVVTFTVAPGPDDGWCVREVGREAHVQPPSLAARIAAIPRVTLEQRGSITLRTGGDPDRFEGIWSGTRMPDGRFYALDPRTESLNVYGMDGALLHALRIPPQYLPGGESRVTLDHHGTVYFGPLLQLEGDASTSHYLSFCDGSDHGTSSPCAHIGDLWLHAPPAKLWIVSRHSVTLLDETREPLVTIERRPNQDWLEGRLEAAVGPDGALAVLDAPHVGSYGVRDTRIICLYSATGDPLTTVTLPSDAQSHWRLALGLKEIVATVGADGFIMDRDGGNLRQFALRASPDGTSRTWTPFVSETSELVLYDGCRTLHSFALAGYEKEEPHPREQ